MTLEEIINLDFISDRTWIHLYIHFEWYDEDYCICDYTKTVSGNWFNDDILRYMRDSRFTAENIVDFTYSPKQDVLRVNMHYKKEG